MAKMKKKQQNEMQDVSAIMQKLAKLATVAGWRCCVQQSMFMVSVI